MPPAQNDSRLPVLLIIIFILWAFPDPPAVPLGGHSTLDLIVEHELRQLHVANTTGYGAFKPQEDRWLNITGLRDEDGFAWDALGKVQGRVRQQVTHLAGGDEEAAKVLDGAAVAPEMALWRNMSGHVRGQWVRSSLDAEIPHPTLNMSALLPWDARDLTRQWERNVTGRTGDLRVDLTEKGEPVESDGVRMQRVKAELMLQDESSSGDGWNIILYGTHFVDAGHVVLTTTSDKFSGMWALPQFALTQKTYERLRGSVVERIQEVVNKQKSVGYPFTKPYSSMPEGRTEDPYTPRCELIVYLQQHPLVALQPDGKLFTPTPGMVAEMEGELRHPQGARPYTPPPMRLSATIFSPDCGFAIESMGPPEYAQTDGNHLTGEKWEVYIRSSIDITIVFGLILAGQVYLTIAQMKHASTPSTRSRVSFYTIGIISLGDGFIGMAFLPLGMLIDSAFPSLLATAFFAFLAVTFFDMRFLLDVWSVQFQERQRAERQQSQATSTTSSTTTAAPTQAPIITAAGADTLPLPVTARTTASSGAAPIILPVETETNAAADPPQTDATRHRRELGSLYGRFYMCLLVLIFLSLHATSWSLTARSIYTNLLAFLYLSLWTPQIYRNIMRNCRKALLYRFVVGQSVLRLLPVWYFYCIQDNVLWVKNDSRVFLGLVAWVWTQLVVLVVQDVLGPRVGIPRTWVPPAYDYHPVLREDDEESRMPIGFATSNEDASTAADAATQPPESKDKSKRIFDCAICMQNIEVPVVPGSGQGGISSGASAGTVHNMVARRLYMLTPCRHIFHTRCLEAAMRYRLQCPVCREGLPPL